MLLPIGDSLEMRPLLGLASADPDDGIDLGVIEARLTDGDQAPNIDTIRRLSWFLIITERLMAVTP